MLDTAYLQLERKRTQNYNFRFQITDYLKHSLNYLKVHAHLSENGF